MTELRRCGAVYPLSRYRCVLPGQHANEHTCPATLPAPRLLVGAYVHDDQGKTWLSWARRSA